MIKISTYLFKKKKIFLFNFFNEKKIQVNFTGLETDHKLSINTFYWEKMESKNPTPRLKSSSIEIYFVPFNNNENNCNYCGTNYSETVLFKQKYCKNCFFNYVKDIKELTNNNICMELIYGIIDVHLNVNINANCKNIHSDNIQEWFCKFSYFRQVITDESFHSIDNFANIKEQDMCNLLIENINYCKLCKKSIYQHNNQIKLKLCSDCYLISSGWIKSSFTEKSIQIIYLPWWDSHGKCMVCTLNLRFISDCQKLCTSCYIFYIGCRYCLTTNIIFGIAIQSQCKNCNNISTIIISDINSINSGNISVDKFLVSTILNNKNNSQISNYIKGINDNYSPLDIYKFIADNLKNTQIMQWIPYSQITNLEKIAVGGFSIVYKATLLDSGKYQYNDFLNIRNKNKHVAIKKFPNTQNIDKYFLNEACYILIIYFIWHLSNLF
jgi:hypothetical protein